MNAAIENFRCDGDYLNEESFLSITPRSMTLLLKPEVPTLWRILKSVSRINQQEKRNKDSKKVYAFIQLENRVHAFRITEHTVGCLSARSFEKL